MNENIDLTKILKDCPEGTKLYSVVHGEVSFISSINDDETNYPITVRLSDNIEEIFTADGKLYQYKDGECILFPSRDQRDWRKFTAPWYKKEEFHPKKLKPFDKVLCRNGLDIWRCDFFSSYNGNRVCPNVCMGDSYLCCIPYNDDTKHLVGTNDEAPEYYKYWED